MFPKMSGLSFHQACALSWTMAFQVSTLESVVCLFVHYIPWVKIYLCMSKGRRTHNDKASLLFINFSLTQHFRLQVSDSIGNYSRILVSKFACLIKYLLMSLKSQDSEVSRTMGNSMMGGENQWTKKCSLNSGHSDNLA